MACDHALLLELSDMKLSKTKRAINPSVSVLCNLGSLYVHVEEMLSAKGHEYDIEAIKGILANPEVKTWIKEMDDSALLPKKR